MLPSARNQFKRTVVSAKTGSVMSGGEKGAEKPGLMLAKTAAFAGGIFATAKSVRSFKEPPPKRVALRRRRVHLGAAERF